MKVVVDACVFAAKQLGDQPQSQESIAFLEACTADKLTLHIPAIIFAEVASAVARAKNSPALGEVAPMKMLRSHNFMIRNVDETFGLRAARLAARFSLRGADSHYIALARELRATLVTDDVEILKYGSSAAECITPAEWLRQRTKKITK